MKGQGQVTVRVLDATGSRTLSGARVAIIRESRIESWTEATTSDDSGAAVFAQAHAGLFDVCARGANHGMACETNVGLVAGGELRVELRLPKGGHLEGQVFLPDGSPAQGVMLRIGEDADLSAWTDTEGRYRLSGLSSGPHVVTLTTQEGPAFPRQVMMESGEDARLDVRLAGFTDVKVVPIRTGPRKGAVVDSVYAGAELSRQKDGSWAGRVEASERNINLYVSGESGGVQVRGHKEVTLSPGIPAVFRVPFGPWKLPALIWTDTPRQRSPGHFELAGHVVLANGRPAEHVHLVRAKPWDGTARCGNTPPSYERFRFDGSAFVVPFQEGEATLYAWTEDGQAGSVTVTGTQNGRVEANIVLKNTGGITGTVDATTLKPEDVAGGLISLDDRGPPPTQVVHPDGRFFVAGLEPGEHSMRVESRQGAPLRVLITEGRLTNLGNVSQPDRAESGP
ncbi:carboxypeptidase-like regulatory domain-containing protein [Corallococcus silvisoli]|uniref:carboxypeptidase-like regulatory domain-containing protein n=1 Tax=Corallococcus silvisoli TaxID=2697031 RepID=UPI0013778C76|nr:carboxypeptidase-like regulatory domain-containing protein [Corallococcus silvisoli]NBD09349.1 hypothetical protein [Corallococcus silvisoli]